MSILILLKFFFFAVLAKLCSSYLKSYYERYSLPRLAAYIAWFQVMKNCLSVSLISEKSEILILSKSSSICPNSSSLSYSSPCRIYLNTSSEWKCSIFTGICFFTNLEKIDDRIDTVLSFKLHMTVNDFAESWTVKDLEWCSPMRL